MPSCFLGWKANHIPALQKKREKKGENTFIQAAQTQDPLTRGIYRAEITGQRRITKVWFPNKRDLRALFCLPNKIKKKWNGDEVAFSRFIMEFLTNVWLGFTGRMCGFIQEIQINTGACSSPMRKMTSLQIGIRSHVSDGLFGVLSKCIIK